jgi:acyl-CoA synthetase (AMP-forming)/AMP-acid ligase II
LRILGRADTVIVTGGENVDPERVEMVLRGHPDIEDAVVVGIPDPEWGHLIVCVFTGEAVRPGEWASKRLPGFMVPKRWIRVTAIPRTPIGKPDRVETRLLAEQCADGGIEGEVEGKTDSHGAQ